MKTILLTTALMLTPVAAVAAPMSEGAAPATGGSTAPGASPAAVPGTGPVTDSNAMPMSGQGSAATTNDSAQVTAAVESGWAKYDADSSGSLSAAEFSTWVSDMKTAEMAAAGKTANPSEVRKYAMAAWKSADKNGDKSVSRDELTGFLGG